MHALLPGRPSFSTTLAPAQTSRRSAADTSSVLTPAGSSAATLYEFASRASLPQAPVALEGGAGLSLGSVFQKWRRRRRRRREWACS